MKKMIFTSVALLFLASVSVAQNTVSAAFSKSYEHEYKGDYAKAVQDINAVYAENSYDINLRMGWLTYMNGEFAKSQSYYKTAIHLSPKSVEPKLGLVYPTAALLNWDEVIKIYEQVLVLDPNNTKANFQLAVTYFVRKDYKKAQGYADKVYNLYPFDYDTNVLLAKIHRGLNDIPTAKNYLNKALNYNPTSVEVNDLLKVVSK